MFSQAKFAVRGRILHFPTVMGKFNPEVAHTHPANLPMPEHFDDGLLVVSKDGKVITAGDAKTLLPQLPKAVPVTHYTHHLITPGFIDCHLHFPQTDVLASFGEQLLQWLSNFTFPAERMYKDPAFCAQMARFFVAMMLRQGTTTGLIMGSVHKCSAEAVFREALRYNMRTICGKVLMDDAGAEAGLDETDGNYGITDTEALIKEWHGKGRLHYAVTPRFAVTSSCTQMKMAGELLRKYPDVYMHTHLSENCAELDAVKARFPHDPNYFEIYASRGLATERSVFAHSIHLSVAEMQRIQKTGSGVAWCAMSNAALGSGLFNHGAVRESNIKIGLGTDVGGGNNFSVLSGCEDSYKLEKLRGGVIHPYSLWYYLTLGGAKTLSLDDKIGNFAAGKEADFAVLDLHSSPVLQRRTSVAADLKDILFACMLLHADSIVAATYVMGAKVYDKATPEPQFVEPPPPPPAMAARDRKLSSKI